jgi:catechol 2,3-dioxygenase-like lactoylglutathione lyase family enzyme
MPGHWRFLELSLPTPDIAASLDFYRCLGFTELVTTDIRTYPYVVVTDGRIAIGLHAETLPGPALSFVQRNVAIWARQLEAAGFELEQQRLGSDDFNEFTLAGPPGHRVMVMEAATFSPMHVSAAPAPVTGPSDHIELGCPDLAEGVEFWRFAGLEPDEEPGTDTVVDVLELAAPAVRLHLKRGGAAAPRLQFASAAAADVAAAAERFGLPLARLGDRWEMAAPEGTVLVLQSP